MLGPVGAPVKNGMCTSLGEFQVLWAFIGDINQQYICGDCKATSSSPEGPNNLCVSHVFQRLISLDRMEHSHLKTIGTLELDPDTLKVPSGKLT